VLSAVAGCALLKKMAAPEDAAKFREETSKKQDRKAVLRLD